MHLTLEEMLPNDQVLGHINQSLFAYKEILYIYKDASRISILYGALALKKPL